jgi:pentatricopeptide repeat domain-containing protein 1
VTYNCLIGTCVAGMQLERAVQLLRSMREAGMRPFDGTYRMIRNACREGPALQALEDMRMVGLLPSNFLTAHDRPGMPDRVLRAAGASIKQTADRLERCVGAEEAAGVLAEASFNPQQLTTLVGMLFERSEQSPVLAWVVEWVRVQGVKDITLYHDMVTAQLRRGDWEQVRRMLDTMKAMGLRAGSSTYVRAIRLCGKTGRWQCALDTLEEMRTEGVQLTGAAYYAALVACGRAGQWQPALELFEQLQASGLAPPQEPYSPLVLVCARRGQREKALQLLDQVSIPSPYPGLMRDDDFGALCRFQATHHGHRLQLGRGFVVPRFHPSPRALRPTLRPCLPVDTRPCAGAGTCGEGGA